VARLLPREGAADADPLMDPQRTQAEEAPDLLVALRPLAPA